MHDIVCALCVHECVHMHMHILCVCMRIVCVSVCVCMCMCMCAMCVYIHVPKYQRAHEQLCVVYVLYAEIGGRGKWERGRVINWHYIRYVHVHVHVRVHTNMHMHTCDACGYNVKCHII